MTIKYTMPINKHNNSLRKYSTVMRLFYNNLSSSLALINIIIDAETLKTV